MPQDVYYHAHWNSLGRQERRRIVPQVVEALLWQAGSSQCDLLAFEDAARLLRAADRVREHQPLILPVLRVGGLEGLAPAMPAQRLHGDVGEGERASALLRLRLFDAEFRFDAL